MENAIEKPINAKTAMENVQKALNDYERSIGLLHVNNVDETEINGYFTMARNDVDSLSPLDCNSIALRLNQLAFFIQRNHNAEQSRLSWTETEITKYAADKTEGVGGQYTKYDNKLYILAKQDDYLNKLLAIRSYCKLRVDRLTYLASSIKNLADTFLSCGRTKIALREKN